jgi:tetratricopeptide (TPR) repeat protein
VFRAILATVVACVAILLALIQFASDGLYARAASPHSLVAHVPLSFGLSVYRALDRIAPVDYVSDALGTTSLAQGDLDAAGRYAAQMRPGERRDDLLAQIAAARGDMDLAREHYFEATDVAAMQKAIADLAKTDISGALSTEARFRDHLIALGTHPDAVADSYYISANYETWLRRYREAFVLDEQALALAPMNMGYILSAANNAYLAGDLTDAQRFFARGIAVSPGKGDCYAGLGLVALRQGDRARALAYLEKARAVDAHAPMIPALAAALR